ncbi:MAG TPA: sulfotransferase [Candidatus Acidoferrum sp.]|jgi:tetratricopeptide (TPR) repeat protein|nr:sulfotransferase [Candidatus Acidoferrum sp.]
MDKPLAKLRPSPRDVALWQKAQHQLLGGQYRPALVAYRDLVRKFPALPELWFELGNAACGELDFTLANTAYRRALELAPNNAPLLGTIGQQFQGLRQLDDARLCYERAVAADPESVDARINLAVWFEKERRLDDAWASVEACLTRHPRDDQARYFRALLLHRKKRNSEAEMALRDLIRDAPRYPYVKYAAPHLLGVVLDELGQYDEAIRWLYEAKAQVRTITDTKLLERAYDEEDRRRRKQLAALTGEMLRRWRAESPASTEKYELAFLGGHPRSGTTLLEQILDSHPQVLAFDEPTAFSQEITNHLPPTSPPHAGDLDSLDRLPPSRRAEMRQRYVKSLLREAPGEPTARVLLDKNPSPTMSLPVWLRVFPELKVIIALRDPRDVVISCFFLNIMLNATNVNFLSLERTTRHYADLMDVWLRLRDLGGFEWLESRYEDVVANLEPEGKRVTEFLGLLWHAEQARYYQNSRRKFLYAPTYHDVTQPVYQRAVGRWERYAQALEPLQARLAPYCNAFGYTS